MQSGIIRFADQSPPPMTLPARADAAPKDFRSTKYERAYEANAISAAAFDAE